MFPIPTEAISLGLGAASGFIFKYLAVQAQDRADQFNRMMQSIDKADNSADLASKRVPNDKNGNIIRRIIVLSVLVGVILCPFILTLIDKTTVVEMTTPVHSFFGLFTWGGNTEFVELPSYLLSKELYQGLLYILGFYFGNGAAKKT